MLPEDYETILTIANPPIPVELRKCVENIKYIGYSHLPHDQRSREYKEHVSDARRRAQTSEDQYGRYQPKIVDFVDQICNHKLSNEDFPYVIPPPIVREASAQRKTSSERKGTSSAFSARFAPSHLRHKSRDDQLAPVQARVDSGDLILSVRSKRGKAKSANVAASSGSSLQVSPVAKPSIKGARLIIFIAGGITMVEIRALNLLMRTYGRNIVVGSTHIITPKLYIHNMKFLNSPKEYFNEKNVKAEKLKIVERQNMAKDMESLQMDEHSEIEQESVPDHIPKNIGKCGCLSFLNN